MEYEAGKSMKKAQNCACRIPIVGIIIAFYKRELREILLFALGERTFCFPGKRRELSVFKGRSPAGKFKLKGSRQKEVVYVQYEIIV